MAATNETLLKVIELEDPDILLMQATTYSLGIGMADGTFNKFIQKNTTIPTKKSDKFSASQVVHQGGVFRILQGDNEKAEHNLLLQELYIGDLLSANPKSKSIEIAFDINADNILHVTITNTETEEKRQATVKGETGLSDDDLAKYVIDRRQ